MFNFALCRVSSPDVRFSIVIVNTQWERLDAKFSGVSATARFASPAKSKSIASSSLQILCVDMPFKWNVFFSSS